MGFLYKISFDRVIWLPKLFESYYPQYSQCSGALGWSLLGVNWNLVIECLLLDSLWTSQDPLCGWMCLLALVSFPCLSGRATWQCGNRSLPLHNGLPGEGQVLSPFYIDGKSQPENGHTMGPRASLDLDASTICNVLCYTCILNCWARKRSLIYKLSLSWWAVEIFQKDQGKSCSWPLFLVEPSGQQKTCLWYAVLVWLVFSSFSVEECSWCVPVNTLGWDLGFPLPLLLVLFALAVGQLLACMPQKQLSTQGHGGAVEAILRCMFRFNEGIGITFHKICAPELYYCIHRPPSKTQPLQK